MHSEKVLYEELRPAAFIQRINACPVAYLPLGTLEWHGLHLPLGADGLQAKGVFERLAQEVGGIVLPMLFVGPDRTVEKEGAAFYGMDAISFEEGHPQQLAGSAYHVADDLFCRILDAVMRNLARAGFQVVIGHGHGPSITAFHERKQVFATQHGLQTYNLGELGFTGAEGIQTDHAAENETSLVMALRPELADLENLAADEIPVGVWGRDPRKTASAALGERLIEKNVARAADALRGIVAGLTRGNMGMRYEAVKDLLSR